MTITELIDQLHDTARMIGAHQHVTINGSPIVGIAVDSSSVVGTHANIVPGQWRYRPNRAQAVTS